jgi:hypothetical protein
MPMPMHALRDAMPYASLQLPRRPRFKFSACSPSLLLLAPNLSQERLARGYCSCPHLLT